MKKALVLCATVPHTLLIEKLKARGNYTLVADMNPKAPAVPVADEFVSISAFDKEAIMQYAKENAIDLVIGEEERFTLYNSSGNKRRIFNCFINAREGDLVVGYQSAPVAQIIALFRVSHEVENPDDILATIGFEKILYIPVGITKQDLIDRGCRVEEPLTRLHPHRSGLADFEHPALHVIVSMLSCPYKY